MAKIWFLDSVFYLVSILVMTPLPSRFSITSGNNLMYVIVKAEISKYCAGRQVCHQPTLAPWRQQKAQGAGLGRLRE